MIRDLVLDAQAAEPAVCQVDLNLPAEQPLRADGDDVADDEHPDHQYRVNRRATKRRVVARKLSTHPGQIEHGGDLAHKVIAWYHLVERKRKKSCSCSCFSCPIIVRLRSESCQSDG